MSLWSLGRVHEALKTLKWRRQTISSLTVAGSRVHGASVLRIEMIQMGELRVRVVRPWETKRVRVRVRVGNWEWRVRVGDWEWQVRVRVRLGVTSETVRVRVGDWEWRVRVRVRVGMTSETVKVRGRAAAPKEEGSRETENEKWEWDGGLGLGILG